LRSPSRGATLSEDFSVKGIDERSLVSDFFSDISLADIRFWPHSPQNLKFGGLDELQIGQSLPNLTPHSPQNLIPSGFSN
jgi:hypothetical protein